MAAAPNITPDTYLVYLHTSPTSPVRILNVRSWEINDDSWLVLSDDEENTLFMAPAPSVLYCLIEQPERVQPRPTISQQLGMHH